jgi:hypothetical protein
LIESLSRSSSREIICTKDLHLCLRVTATRGAGERKQRRRLLSTTTHFVHPSIRKLYPKYCTTDVCFVSCRAQTLIFDLAKPVIPLSFQPTGYS